MIVTFIIVLIQSSNLITRWTGAVTISTRSGEFICCNEGWSHNCFIQEFIHKTSTFEAVLDTQIRIGLCFDKIFDTWIQRFSKPRSLLGYGECGSSPHIVKNSSLNVSKVCSKLVPHTTIPRLNRINFACVHVIFSLISICNCMNKQTPDEKV